MSLAIVPSRYIAIIGAPPLEDNNYKIDPTKFWMRTGVTAVALAACSIFFSIFYPYMLLLTTAITFLDFGQVKKGSDNKLVDIATEKAPFSRPAFESACLAIFNDKNLANSFLKRWGNVNKLLDHTSHYPILKEEVFTLFAPYIGYSDSKGGANTRLSELLFFLPEDKLSYLIQNHLIRADQFSLDQQGQLFESCLWNQEKMLRLQQAGFQPKQRFQESLLVLLRKLPDLERLSHPDLDPKNLAHAHILLNYPNKEGDSLNTRFKNISRNVHPDKNLDNKDQAEAAFKKLQVAYETLKSKNSL